MMSLVELQAAACGTAVISYDKYEIKTHLDDLEKITFDILWNPWAYKKFVEKNRKIVLQNHAPENIAKTLQADISRVENNIFIQPASRELIEQHMDDIEKIEVEFLSDVGVWERENFTSEYYNKFDCSYLLFKWSTVIGYVIGHTNNNYGYINRIAISQKESWQWLWNYLITCFNDNLKYNLSIDIVELVTHDSLKVDSFYLKEGFELYEKSEKITEFLKRKWKESTYEDYVWEKKYMKIFYKHL